MLTLNDGRTMPQLGLGVWQTPPDVTAAVVGAAIRAGYRSIDTAAAYRNERGVGAGVAAAGLPLSDLRITTKLWNDSHGYDAALTAFDGSLKRLGLDAVDLYLIHWPGQDDKVEVATWKAFIKVRDDGRSRSIGVSNFSADQIRRLQDATGVTPAVNQVQLHPRSQQAALRAFHEAQGIITESWSPLGQGRVLDDPALVHIAKAHGRTTAQVVIRWHLDLGLMVIPKTVTPSRLAENFDVFGFTLTPEDHAAIAAMDGAR